MAPKKATHYVYRTPYGPITIGTRNNAICAVVLGNTHLDGEATPTALSNACATELLEYFAGKRRAFSMPLALEGTAFQQDVWRAICKIPYGRTSTTLDIASAIGKPESFRMVGSALKKCPVSVLVPTHRIVGANGKTPGADKLAQLRAALLELERRNMQTL